MSVLFNRSLSVHLFCSPHSLRCWSVDPVGETAAGKASRSLAQHIPGPGGIEGMKGAASGVMGDLARARIALDERGQKLGELEERTALMMNSADNFSKHAHDVSNNYTVRGRRFTDVMCSCDIEPLGGSISTYNA